MERLPRIVAAYSDPDCAAGCEAIVEFIDAVKAGVPAALSEVTTLGCTLTK